MPAPSAQYPASGELHLPLPGMRSGGAASCLKLSRLSEILLHPRMVWCRGKFRSKSWQGVLEEAKELVASGVKELNLIAEDTNQYGMLTSPPQHLPLSVLLLCT